MKLMMIVPLAALLFMTTPSFAENREGGGRLGANAVYLNFMSYGTGIDYKSLAVANALIQEIEADGNVVEKVVKQQGREGETLLCVELANSGLRVEFIREVAPSILEDREQTPKKRTSVRVGPDCSDYDSATEQDLTAYLRK